MLDMLSQVSGQLQVRGSNSHTSNGSIIAQVSCSGGAFRKKCKGKKILHGPARVEKKKRKMKVKKKGWREFKGEVKRAIPTVPVSRPHNKDFHDEKERRIGRRWRAGNGNNETPTKALFSFSLKPTRGKR
ncbi:hypothetical protein PoB_007685100 [Plakobranchus ocellatus]|uniref:Uncharacterized protein n=1 Tax=Plakobranchus ocellatus TaxID=259542 RepID=A0AAV4E1W0_9GAST|nr:hypothetical protein PoB_007685100 [Plakobranchus ocellatus]